MHNTTVAPDYYHDYYSKLLLRPTSTTHLLIPSVPAIVIQDVWILLSVRTVQFECCLPPQSCTLVRGLTL